jgi:hypothetical protein
LSSGSLPETKSRATSHFLTLSFSGHLPDVNGAEARVL